ncbi:DUF885 domain-containing protein [Nitrosococcus oceani]|uniref:DUF885 domain-containing protein n=1 Tax=Nitrosococcus oceani TaxID=1229 RepID=UPI0004E8A46D|nr:DUF885 domain-containing protein [Nitrosococcus oceani]KFI22870.1 hypothetical protein HW44_06990 [Nitrosococcus oceani]
MRKNFSPFLGSAVLFFLTLLLLFAGIPETRAAENNTHWDAFVHNFVEKYFAANPDFAVRAGRHEFDGKLPDWSPEALAKEVARLRSERQRALAFEVASLTASQHFERDYLVAWIDKDLFWLETAEWPYRNPAFYTQELDPNVYLSRPYAPLEERMRAYIAYAEAIPAAAKQIRHNLRTPLPLTYVDIGEKVFGGLAAYYERDAPAIFSTVENELLQRKFRAANRHAIRAMKELQQWLQTQRTNATSDFALGAPLFRALLRETEGVKISLERLEQIGRQDLKRNLVALQKACGNYAPSKTVSECIEKARAVKPEKGPVEEARRQLQKLKEFVIAKDLVTIPSAEQAQVAASPPYMQWNFAYIDIPGPFDKGLPAIYYVAPPDPAWSKAEREDYLADKADLLFVSVHEVWPGHFLQFLHSNRVASPLGKLFVGYGFAEGWAHYVEEMMWKAGLGHGDPEIHIGQLLNALLRNVRYLSAIGLHTQRMTLEESERMFQEFAHQDVGTARQQAARGTFDPAYITYTLGKLMIKKLREEWTATRGEREGWRVFHDKFLSYGGPPIPLIRKEMLGENAGPAL